MPYDANNMWKPEDDTVAGRLPGLLASSSPVMKAAEATGLRTANRRGLLNSSIAVGASTDAVVKAALPIAGQDAATAANKNLSAQGHAQNLGALSTNIQGTKEINREQQAATASLQQAEAAARQRLTETQIASAERIAAAEIAAKEGMLGRQLTADEKAQERTIAANDAYQGKAIDAAAGQQKAQIASTEGMQKTQLQATKDMQAAEAASRAALQQSQLASTEAIARWNVSSHDKAAAMQATIAMRNSYTQMFDSILNNPNLPADVREQYLVHAKALLAANDGVIKSIYQSSVIWEPPIVQAAA